MDALYLYMFIFFKSRMLFVTWYCKREETVASNLSYMFIVNHELTQTD